VSENRGTDSVHEEGPTTELLKSPENVGNKVGGNTFEKIQIQMMCI